MEQGIFPAKQGIVFKEAGKLACRNRAPHDRHRVRRERLLCELVAVIDSVDWRAPGQRWRPASRADRCGRLTHKYLVRWRRPASQRNLPRQWKSILLPAVARPGPWHQGQSALSAAREDSAVHLLVGRYRDRGDVLSSWTPKEFIT
jgi:hypothetical protein